MKAVITWLDAIVSSVPLPMLEVWGRFAYVIGLLLAVCAFGGFTFRVGEHWGFGRARQAWDAKAFLSVPLTFVLIIATGYIGSFVVLVPGAQTFESLKDLTVLLSIVLLGYPALITIPFAYGLSDLIEGVPPEFLLAWLPGYFVNPACFWIAYQFLGKNPDFRMTRTWWRYLAAAVLFMTLEPVLWGYVCSDQFPSGISYHSITPALFFTTSITWLMGPVAFLAVLPLARRYGWFWAEIPGHVKERTIRGREWIWEAGRSETRGSAGPAQEGLPIRIFIFTPFIVLLLVMVGATAIVALQTADDDARMLATRLHQAMSANIRVQLDDHLARSPSLEDAQRDDTLASLLRSQAVGTNGRAFIVDANAKVIASSASAGDPVVESAITALARHAGPSSLSAEATEFQFDHVTAKPLSRETWLTYATVYGGDSAGRRWILVTAMPEAFYLAGLRKASSRSAMVFALALVLSLVLGAALASMVTAPLRQMANATRAMAHGDLDVRVPGSKLDELAALAESFNAMAARLKKSFDDLVGEVETRKSRESELKDSEARLRTSEERLKLAIDGAGLGIWDWDIEQDRLVWDDSMYRLYGVHKDVFSGAFDAWSRCLVPEDVARVNADVEAALRGGREFTSDFRVRRADGAIRVIRGVAQIVRTADGRPMRMIGINRDVTDLVNAEREHEQLTRMARLTTMGELTASIAHEINQPLAAVVVNGNAALRWLAHAPPNLNETRDALKHIVEQGNRAGEVVTRIRELLKHHKPEYVALDINETIREVLSLTESALRSRSVMVKTILPADLPLALGDRVQLQQVIMNLTMNGADAMSSVTDRPRVLRIGSMVADEGSIQVTIEDSGIGIEEAIRHRIFDPLFTTKPTGMGMGLSICRSIIEAHGGRLWASPGTPHGANFQFTIPSADRPKKPA